jgi:hypothetical protein
MRRLEMVSDSSRLMMSLIAKMLRWISLTPTTKATLSNIRENEQRRMLLMVTVFLDGPILILTPPCPLLMSLSERKRM